MGSVANVLDVSDVIGQVLKYDLGSLTKEHVYFVRWYTVPEKTRVGSVCERRP
jgi:hypothetical protein